MNLTLTGAIVLMLAWIALALLAQVPSGAVHLLYAAAVILLARRVLLGAPRFRS